MSVGQLCNYHHLRPPKKLEERRQVDYELHGLSRLSDFLDTADGNLPQGTVLCVLCVAVAVWMWCGVAECLWLV